MRRPLILTLVLLLSTTSQVICHVEATSGRAGVDLYVSGYSFDYTDSNDEASYRMFSSNHPISGFNRPATLFIIDGMVGAPLRTTFTMTNAGTGDSGQFNALITILHDEYISFELLNTTVSVPNVPGSSSSTAYFDWTPDYSGNHSMTIELQNSNDDVPSNNARTRHLTIGWMYSNCDDISQWSAGTGWGLNSEATISKNSACHVGNGESGNYGNGWATSLDSPTWDLSDLAENPTRVVGFGFFFTGSILTGDLLSLQARAKDGSWEQVGSISGTVDSSFLDGSTNWQTFSNTVGSQTSPAIAMQSQHFHTQSQLRFHFTSDASGTAIGYWVDDIVLFYDQQARVEEIDWRIGDVGSGETQRNKWSEQSITIHNDGNLSDRFIPSVTGLPTGWDTSFSHETGSSIHPQNGVRVGPGEEKTIRIQIRPDGNASVGQQEFTFTATSHIQSGVTDSRKITMTVLPDYIPSITPQDMIPVCAAGNTCQFFVEASNIGDSTDTFDITVNPFDIKQGWTLGLAWDQDSSVSISPGTPTNIKMMVSVPEGEDPDVSSTVELTLVSRTDPSKQDIESISAAASMISDAEFSLASEDIPADGWQVEPGDTVELRFTLWNNASRQDIFRFSLDTQGGRTWTVDFPDYPDMPVNPGSSTFFTISITAPSTAQAGDPGPIIIPQAQSLRSYTNASTFQFGDLVVATLKDITLRDSQMPLWLYPGIPTGFDVEIENEGNGPVDAVFSMPDLPATWEWWTVVDGVNISGPIRLTPTYEQQHIAEVEIVILAPPVEAANEAIGFTIMVSPWEGEDINPDDNQIQHEVMTAAIRFPTIDLGDVQAMRMDTDGQLEIRFNITNQGNSGESAMRVMAEHVSNPPGADVSIIIESRGVSTLGSEWHEMAFATGSSMEYIMTVMASSDLVLNTALNISLNVVGGLDENGQPYHIIRYIEVIADTRRSVSANLVSQTLGTTVEEYHSFIIEVESRSSVPEIIQVSLEGEREFSCDESEDIRNATIELPAAPLSNPVFMSLECTVRMGEGEYSEDIRLTLTTDSEVITSWSMSAYIEDEQEETENMFSELGTTEWVSGGGVIILLLVVGLILMSRKEEEEVMEEVEESPYQYQETVQSPYPIHEYPSMQTQSYSHQVATIPAGPPASFAVVSDPAPVSQNTTETSRTWSREELLNAGWTDDQINQAYPELSYVQPVTGLSNAFDALGGNPPVVEEDSTETGLGLPSVNCMITGRLLTTEDQWAQCPGCGGWASAEEKATTPDCPRCRATW